MCSVHAACMWHARNIHAKMHTYSTRAAYMWHMRSIYTTYMQRACNIVQHPCTLAPHKGAASMHTCTAQGYSIYAYVHRTRVQHPCIRAPHKGAAHNAVINGAQIYWRTCSNWIPLLAAKIDKMCAVPWVFVFLAHSPSRKVVSN